MCTQKNTYLLLNLQQPALLHHLRKNAAPFRRLTRQREQNFAVCLPRLLAEDLSLERCLAFVHLVENGSSLVVERHGEFMQTCSSRFGRQEVQVQARKVSVA